jgi:hypothetical protein
MHIFENKKNFILKGKNFAKRSVFLFLAVFVLSSLVGSFVTSKEIVKIIGLTSVLSMLFFSLSAVCFFLLQIEVWENEYE